MMSKTTIKIAGLLPTVIIFGCGPGDVSGGTDSAVTLDAPALDGGTDATGSSDAALVDAASPDAVVATACAPYPCPVGALCYEANGLVHAPTLADPIHRLSYLPPTGTYTKFRLEMDVYHGGWATEPGAIRHNLFWIARDKYNFDMIGYANFEKPNKVHVVHGFGMVHVDKPKIRVNATLPQNETYHVSYTYDLAAQVLSLVVTRGGNPVATVSATPNVTSIPFSNNDTIDVEFGFDGVLNPAEPVTYGWEYRDVCLQVIP